MGNRRRRVGTILATVLGLIGGLVPAVAAAATTGALPRGDLSIRNADFEAGLASWTSTCPSAVASVFGAAANGVISDSAETGDPAADSGGLAARLTVTADCPKPSLTSTVILATPGETYTATVWARAAGGAEVPATATGSIGLVFLNAARAVISRAEGTATQSVEGERLRVRGKAPAAAKFVSVVLTARAAMPEATEGDYLDETGGAAVVFDDVQITRRFTDLGPQLSTTYVRSVAFGKGTNGRNAVYAVSDGGGGSPARLNAIDLDSGAVTKSFPLPGVGGGSWATTTASDGTIYTATFSPAGLWAYKPGAAAPRRVASLAGSSTPFAIASGPGGAIYVGGYANGVVYRYLPGKGIKPFVNAKKLTGQDYVRSLAVDPTLGVLYIGTGTRATLLACSLKTAACNAITPAAARGQQFVYQLAAAPGKVFAYLLPAGTMAVVDVSAKPGGGFTGRAVRVLDGVTDPGASGIVAGGVYYRGPGGRLYSYDGPTNTGVAVGSGSVPALRGWGSLKLADQDAMPGVSLMAAGGIEGGVEIIAYNPASNRTTRSRVTGLSGAGVSIQSVAAGPDGDIYVGGYLVGGLGSYVPFQPGAGASIPAVPQAESMATLGDTLYVGGYPNAVIQAYRPTADGSVAAPPTTVCTLGGSGQDRPYAMAAGGGRLYIGTMAGYGKLAGALTVYDPATRRCTTHRSIVPNQSIVSLAYHEGVVYGGTLVWGGFGVRPTQTRATLLMYYPSTGKSRTIALPVAAASLQGLTVAPDGNIWMLAQNYLLTFNPKLRKFVRRQLLYPGLSYPKPPFTSTGRIAPYDGMLAIGADGALYGALHRSFFFRIDPKTKVVTQLYRGPITGLAADSDGSLYFARGSHLIRFVP